MTLEEFVKRKPELTVLTDQPLTPELAERTFDADPFNFRYKLGPVYDILRYREPPPEGKQKTEREDSNTPMAILISGGWGTGKTSAMKWLECLLEKWRYEAGPNDVKVRPVWFYPWKYDKKEEVWRGLLAEVIANSIEIKNLTVKRLQYGVICFIRLPLRLIGLVVDSVKFKIQSPESLLSAEIGPGTLKKILTEYREASHPDEAYRNKFEKALKLWIRNTIGKKERMVIFIDDLDRCMPDIALQVLEALKLYLNIPNLIFVVGVDKDVVSRLVVEHYRKLALVPKKEKPEEGPDKDAREKAEAKARLYLSKMFQVEIELSPNQEQIRGFLDTHLDGISLWEEKLSPEHRRLFRGLVLSLAGRNPREVKRILNSALMSAAGVEAARVEQGKAPPTFAQGMQDYFIRRILQKPQYGRLTGMIDTDEGRKFFSVWSQVACKGYTASPEKLSDVLPDYVLRKGPSEKEDE